MLFTSYAMLRTVRAVTHLDVSRDQADRAAAALLALLG